MFWVKLICAKLNQIGLTTAFENQKPVTDNGKLINSFNQIIQRMKTQIFFCILSKTRAQMLSLKL